MIKLIVSDIDGTLLTEGTHELKPEFFEVLLKLRSKGIQFAAASGRHWISIDRLFQPVKEKIFYIADNGSYIGTYHRQLFTFAPPKDVLDQLIRDVRTMDGMDLVASCRDAVYMEHKGGECWDWLIHGYQYKLNYVEDLTAMEPEITKMAVYRSKDIEPSTKGLREKYGDKLKMSISGGPWLDIMEKTVNKGAAVKTLQESLDISPRETMVFGDQMNDVEMLKQAYYSFAVGGARREVKEAARFQTDLTEQDGVLKVLKTLL